MINAGLLSVIVPVYNVEKYLVRCVQSVMKQTYINLEIILVDDGSPDKSGEICDMLARTDRRITVIHQENRGLCGARNSGLVKAKGDYIAFLDSDDWIEPQMYESLIDLIIMHDLDMARCSIDQTDGEFHTDLLPNEKNANVIITGESVFELYFHEFLCKVVWNAVYKRHIVQNVIYPEGYQSEDNYASGKYLYNCNRMMITTEKLYHYWINPNSITRSNTIRKSDICMCTKLLIDDLKMEGMNSEYFLYKLNQKLARELYHYIREKDERCYVVAIQRSQKKYIETYLDLLRRIRFKFLLKKFNIKVYD